jgi:hypothetical protein
MSAPVCMAGRGLGAKSTSMIVQAIPAKTAARARTWSVTTNALAFRGMPVKIVL